MKVIKLIYLFTLTFFCQVGFSQNYEIVKSFDLQMDKSIEKRLDSTNITDALTTHLEIPANYEFKIHTIKGTRDKTSEKDDLGYVHERYAQYYKGIKIEHSDIRVRYLNDLFVSANGEYIDAQHVDISTILSSENAIEKAKDYIGAKKYMWEDESENDWLRNVMNDETSTYYPDTELVICKNSFDFRDTLFYVAYKIDIYAKEPISRDYIFIDAKNGNVLAVNPILVTVFGPAATRYSGTRNISTQQIGNAFRLRGYDNNLNVETFNMNRGTNYATATDFVDNDNNWTAAEYNNANKDNGALDAHWGTMMTFDYFRNVHGRNSYDNNGAVLRSFVHYGTNFENAFWDGLRMTYGDGASRFDILTSLDVVAHEIGHGVTQFSANLVYSGESGAINETYSDIWAACVQNYAAPNKNIWLIGDEISYTTPLRNMSNPLLSNPPQPNTYGGGANWTGSNASVHINSGIMNHWFFILSVGKSGTNGKGNSYNVTGIGILKAERIAYRALTRYMTTGTTFNNARAHTIQSAIDLFGSCSSEVIAVTNAWYAVGVGNQSTDQKIISNVTYTSNTTITNCNVILNNVKIQNNAKLTLSNAKEVTFTGTFEVELGAELEIK